MTLGTFSELVGRVRSVAQTVRGAAGEKPVDVSSWTRARIERKRFAEHLHRGIPQAEVLEEDLEAFEKREWREHFSHKLTGHGLEIGPLHRPMVQHPGMNVDYIDRCTVAELREHYPELVALPLVEPDIIGDAQDLRSVPAGKYDFVIAAHVIEHMRDPIRALSSWCRVVRREGLIYIIAPDKRAIFDKHRVRTTLEHLILDYREPSQERDFEHYLDYAIHVHGKSGDAALAEAKRLLDVDYSIHYHTFIPSDVKRLLEWFSANVLPIDIIEGPSMAPGSDEFHLLVRVR